MNLNNKKKVHGPISALKKQKTNIDMEIIKAKIGALKKPNKIDKSPARLMKGESPNKLY